MSDSTAECLGHRPTQVIDNDCPNLHIRHQKDCIRTIVVLGAAQVGLKPVIIYAAYQADNLCTN